MVIQDDTERKTTPPPPPVEEAPSVDEVLQADTSHIIIQQTLEGLSYDIPHAPIDSGAIKLPGLPDSIVL